MNRSRWQVLCFVLLLSSCVSLEHRVRNTTDELQGAQVADDLEPSEEYELGRATSAVVVDAFPLLDLKSDAAVAHTLYLNDLAALLEGVSHDTPRSGIRLGGLVPRDADAQEQVNSLVLYRGLQVGVLEDVSPMVFSTPGGFIWVSRGMVALCDSEDEAAALLAIELAHVVLDHSMTQYRKAYDDTIPETAKANEWFAGDGMTANFGRLAVSLQEDITGTHHAAKYNLEADRFAALVLLQAGYEPRAIVSLLLKLAVALRSPSRRGHWLARQTDLDTRVASLSSFIENMEMRVALTYSNKAAFRQARFDAAMGR